MSVGAWYLLKKRHVELARTMIRVALPVFAIMAVLQVFVFGANQAVAVTENQPEKLAAMEGLYETDGLRTDVHRRLVRHLRRNRRRAYRFRACSASWPPRTSRGRSKGLESVPAGPVGAGQPGVPGVPPDDRPRDGVPAHIACWRSGMWVLEEEDLGHPLARCGSWCPPSCSPSSPPRPAGGQPSSADNRGWCGRSCAPTGAESPLVGTTQVAFSIGMFVVLYALLLGLFLWLMDRKIKAGPPEEEDEEEPTHFRTPSRRCSGAARGCRAEPT